MSDMAAAGVGGIPPTYPVKPVQPGTRDRKSGQRKKDLPKQDIDREKPEENERRDESDGGDKPAIDEYV